MSPLAPAPVPGSARPDPAVGAVAPPMTAVRALRQRTRDLHVRAEAHFPLVRPDLDLAGYTATLRALLGVHAPLEAAAGAVLAGVEGAGPWSDAALRVAGWRMWRRAPLLRADLEALGATDLAPPAGGVGAAGGGVALLPELTDVPAALGALYVLEGSALGGLVVAEVVRARLGPAVPCGYLVGSGAGTAVRWARFRRVADDLLARVDIDEAVVAARGTFAAIEVAVAGAVPA